MRYSARVKRLKLILAVLSGFLLIVVVLQNTETVVTEVLFYSLSLPLAALLLVTLLVGFVFGALFGAWMKRRSKGRSEARPAAPPKGGGATERI